LLKTPWFKRAQEGNIKLALNSFRLYFPTLVLLLALASLSLIDSFDKYSTVPMGLGLGVFVSTLLLKARDLTIPLWLGKQLARWGGVSVLMSVMIGFIQF
jgi:hypothetical protein